MARNKRAYPLEVRERARDLRRQGWTYREIIAELGNGIAKNTLTEWFRDIELTTEQKARIRQIELEARARGRLVWNERNRELKRERLRAAQTWAEPIADRVVQDRDALRLMAAALWLGEGDKKNDLLGFANSDPRIITAWMRLLRSSFDIDEQKFACQLFISEGMPE